MKSLPYVTGTGGNPSGFQEDVVELICRQSWENEPTVGDVLRRKGVEFDQYMIYCRADLMGIMRNESRFDCGAVNESSIERSYGCYQINLKVHRHIDRAQAHDLFYSSAWTISRLVSYGWVPRTLNGKDNRYAIQCHNGCNADNGYWQSAVGYSNKYIDKLINNN